MIEVEQTPQPLASLHGASAVIVRLQAQRRDESIADTLVVSLSVVVLDKLGNEHAKMPLTERDDAAQTLAANGSNEALGVSVEIGVPTRQADAADAGRAEQADKVLPENRVAIMDQESRILEEALDRIEQYAQGVQYPRPDAGHG